jgi:choline monooxygenase
VEPVSECETLDHLQIYYPGKAADSEQYESSRKTRLQDWEKVFKEDIEVVEGMQRGRRSRAFSGGVFSPVLDTPSHYFAKWVANQLGNS